MEDIKKTLGIEIPDDEEITEEMLRRRPRSSNPT